MFNAWASAPKFTRTTPEPQAPPHLTAIPSSSALPAQPGQCCSWHHRGLSAPLPRNSHSHFGYIRLNLLGFSPSPWAVHSSSSLLHQEILFAPLSSASSCPVTVLPEGPHWRQHKGMHLELVPRRFVLSRHGRQAENARLYSIDWKGCIGFKCILNKTYLELKHDALWAHICFLTYLI